MELLTHCPVRTLDVAPIFGLENDFSTREHIRTFLELIERSDSNPTLL